AEAAAARGSGIVRVQRLPQRLHIIAGRLGQLDRKVPAAPGDLTGRHGALRNDCAGGPYPNSVDKRLRHIKRRTYACAGRDRFSIADFSSASTSSSLISFNWASICDL